ncbi:MAG: XRE family transcriptional regulator [Sedimenticola sp.]
MQRLHDEIGASELGNRLRMAREDASITQAHAAKDVGVARTTLVAIEKGQRRVKIEELREFARLYGTTVNSLLRKEALHVDLVPRFRRHFNSNEKLSEEAASILSHFVKAEVELENLLGVQRTRNYPPERPLLSGDVVQQAEQDANELRQWLGLSNSPVLDIISILELDLGVRVYIKKMDSGISGLFAYEESLGACILLNGNHPKDRRKNTAAHELGHFIATRRMPEVLCESDPVKSREERYAIAFANAFLMPSRAILGKFKEVTAGSTQFTRRHIIILSHTFGVSREAMVRRCEHLGAVAKGTWDWFGMNGGITDKQALEVLGEMAVPNRDQAVSEKPTTYRLNSLVCQAWSQGLLSEGQLAHLLDISRGDLREIIDSYDLDWSDADDAPSL